MDRRRAARVSSTAVPTEGLGALRASRCGVRAAGGAGLGAIQVGMLRALYARGVGRSETWPGLPGQPVTGLLGFLGARDHLVPESGLRRLISRHVERGELDDLPILSHVVTVDVITGEELRLSHGPGLDPVQPVP